MPAALLGAVTCGRCAHQQASGDACERCGARWVPAALGTATPAAPGPVAGVVRASVRRRWLAQLVDVAVPVLLVALAIAESAGVLPRTVPVWLLVFAAVAVVLVQMVVLTLSGRSLGRWLLGQRTVEDLTGLPLRPGHLVRQLRQAARPVRLITADLHRGRDPVEPQLAARGQGVAAVAHPTSALPLATGGAPVATTTEADERPSVGIVLESGERYQIHRSLVIGRNPVDPVAGVDRDLLAWPDLSRRLAKTHVLLEWTGTVLWVTDLNSSTGTALVSAGGDRQPLLPGVRTSAAVGSLILCGGRSIKVVSHG